MRKHFRGLKNAHFGKDIWVVAAGASLGYVDKEFFKNKITIGINGVYDLVQTTYLIRKERERRQRALESGIPLVISEYDCGNKFRGANLLEGDYWYFGHEENMSTVIDLDVIGGDEKLVVSASTITSAMHLAAYMGAVNIVLVGHDCGTLDGMMNPAGYHEPFGGEKYYREWIREIEPQTVMVRERLQEVYGCRVYSLNPFLNFGLEGHLYER